MKPLSGSSYGRAMEQHFNKCNAMRNAVIKDAQKHIQTTQDALGALMGAGVLLEKKYYGGKNFISCITDVAPRPGKPVHEIFRAWVNLARALQVLGVREDPYIAVKKHKRGRSIHE